MKKIILVLITFFILFNTNVKANSIDSINMDIYIDNNGDAHITETWDAYLDQGTEGYKPYYNLGNATITNYSVKDEKKSYTTLDSWDTTGTLSDKAYKAGINYIDSGLELCFGISSYGQHTYTMSYIIKGFVTKTIDDQMVYWTLIPSDLSVKPKNVYIKIYADNKFSDELPVWGYGNYGGTAYVYDGYIEMGKEDLGTDEYMTILIDFPADTFNTTNVLDQNIDYYKNMASEGSTSYVEENTTLDTIIGIIFAFGNVIFWTLFIIGMSAMAKQNLNKSGSKKLEYGTTTNRLPKEVNLFRELPCEKDLYRAFWLASNYNLMKKKTDFLGVILLKWLKQGKISIEQKTVGLVFKKEDTTITFIDDKLDTELEKTLYSYMVEASKDGVLESKEFEKWCSSNYSNILKWFDDILDYQNDILIKENKLKEKEITTLKVFKSTVYEVDSSMYEEAVKMKGLKQFFKEFETMKDKEAKYVMLWEEYLMYAQIFGVADKVAKQFKEMYPELINSETGYNYTNIIFLNNIAYSGMSSASSAQTRAQSYSAGGGGFSSGGGGMGSFGGGGGGGGFR